MHGLDITVISAERGKEVVVVTRLDGKVMARVNLDEARTEALIRSLVQRRTVLFAANSAEPGDEPLQTAHDPKWDVEKPTPDGAVVVNLRHPGTGWLRFQFPQAKAAKLSAALIHRGD